LRPPRPASEDRSLDPSDAPTGELPIIESRSASDESAPADEPTSGSSRRLPTPKAIVAGLAALVPLAIVAATALGFGGPATDAVCGVGAGFLGENCTTTTVVQSEPPEPSADTTAPPAGGTIESTSTVAADPAPPDEISSSYPDGFDTTAASGAIASGCAPAAGPLPDGLWFGFVAALDAASLPLDVACAFSGSNAQGQAQSRSEVAVKPIYVTNDATGIRTIPVAPGAIVRPLDASGAVAAPAPLVSFASNAGSGVPMAIWVYVDGGVATEVVLQDSAAVQVATGPAAANNCPSGQGPSAVALEVAGIAADDPDGGLNIRSGAGTANAVVATLPNGTSVTALGGCEVVANRVWWQVSTSSGAAWTRASYLVPA
jgi:hypothetical protein